MATNTIKLSAIFRLRRDNDYNYQKIAETFIPQRGEVCLVDTSLNGLRAKIGDGISNFKTLPFADDDIALNIIIRGYYFNDKFYSDVELTNEISASVNKIYIDVAKSAVYIFDGEQFLLVSQTVAAASSTTAGILKLYDTTGDNIDGTMTQKAITKELNEKVEVDINAEEELLMFN